MKSIYIKKFWEEENILFYLHSIDDVIVRQIEIQGDKKVCLDEENPICGEFSLVDVTLSELDIDNPTYISAEEFDIVWNSRNNVIFIPEGDIFKLGYVTSYAHGCNCAGAMGKGIALQFRERFPLMYEEYKLRCRKKEFLLGDVFIYPTAEGFVYNLGTQKDWRTIADMEALKESVMKMLKHASNSNVRTIALPKIGAGLGKLDWYEVKRVLQHLSSEFPMVRLFVVEEYIS